ncbi:MAG: diadenylate cyclase CdaA [Lentisphaeria bacterium]|nr:diadenylate cyclase CdaA [Lentisphaeria bacterium]
MWRPFLTILIGYAKIAMEVGLLAFLIYLALQFVRGTRAATMLAGATILVLALGFLSQFFGLEVIEWIVAKMWAVLAFSVLIVFQPEIRRALAEIGRQRSFLRISNEFLREGELISTVVDATFFMADRRIGALIAIEQSIGLRSYAETGTAVNATVSSKLISAMFFPNSPLHDGGIIISKGQLVAAGCIFPLSQNTDMTRMVGTRHRAGLGLTEETDAVVIIVSEETGAVSLARRGRLTRGVDRGRLKRHLTNYLIKKKGAREVQPATAAVQSLPVEEKTQVELGEG